MATLVLDETFIRILQSWLWPFFRIAGLFMTAPVIGTRSVPLRIRLILAIAVTMVIVPVLPAPPLINVFSAIGMLTTIQQVLIGIAMGLSVRVIFVVLEIAGQLIGQLMGLMLASMVDPQNGNQVPIVGQLYLLLATLLFLGLDGHLIMIEAVANSFYQLPVGTMGISRDVAWEFLTWTSSILATGVLIALPAVASLLIVNLAFGVMTKASPQLNIFAVGFPIMIILGVVIILFTLSDFIPQMIELYEESFVMLNRIVS